MQVGEENLNPTMRRTRNFDYNTVSHILIKCEEDAEESVVEEKKRQPKASLKG